MLRRILAITLLIAFGFPLVAPAFASTPDAEASLPACCRTHGAHHCAMLHNVTPTTSPTFKAAPCPFYPAPSATLPNATATIAASPTFTTHPYRTLIALSATPRRPVRIFLSSSNLKRGPPIPTA